MDIQKKKVTGSRPLSAFSKRAVAATLGISAAYSLNACGGDTTSGQVLGPVPQENNPNLESSDSEQDFSSSSKYLDIPQSHEAISSEVLEALSSAAQSAASSKTTSSSAFMPSSSSSAAQTSSAAQLASSSSAQPISSTQVASSVSTTTSSATAPVSSAEQSTSSASQPVSSSNAPISSAVQPISSANGPTSSTAQPMSSTETQPANSSSSNNGWGVNPCENLSPGDTVRSVGGFGSQVFICPDPTSSSSDPFQHGFSMVTTFELDDVMV
ncbi:MAG: hypothetical protein IKS96_10225 [Fibrobacter sp.]|nr:hypothetical protein [Fibrobacter sp.]